MKIRNKAAPVHFLLNVQAFGIIQQKKGSDIMEEKNIYSDSTRMNYGDGFSDDDAPQLPQQPVNMQQPVRGGVPVRYKKPKLKKKKKGKIVFGVILLILLVIFLTAGIYLVLVLSRIHYTFDFTDHSIAESNGITLKEESGVTNIMLFGEDNHKEGENGRADSMILLSIDKNNGQLKQTSFMRDIFVSIPGYDDNKLNAAYAFGGAKLACETIENNFGIKIDDYLIVDFNSFTEIVDSLGGIDLELTYNEIAYINWQSYRNHQTDDENELKKDEYDYYEDKDGYSVALVHVNGRQALWYARDRDSAGSDFDRTQRQRIVINTIFTKLKESNPFTLLGTVFSASKYLTTNMNPLSLTGKGFELLGALSYERKEHRIPSNDNYYNDYYDYCGQVLVISNIDLEKERLYSYISEKQ